jgi:predicted transcriptional regulator
MQPLPPDLTARIQQKVDAHLYTSQEDVIRHALDTLDDWQEYERREVLKGLEQAERGELVDAAVVFAELRALLPDDPAQGV